MTDRELLELAAKAAGVFITKEQFEAECTSPWDPDWVPRYDEANGSIRGWRTWHGSSGEIGGWEGYEWRPLADDGEAMRLMVKLEIALSFERQGEVSASRDDLRWEFPEEFADHNGDRNAAARRAIVRAAAATQDPRLE